MPSELNSYWHYTYITASVCLFTLFASNVTLGKNFNFLDISSENILLIKEFFLSVISTLFLISSAVALFARDLTDTISSYAKEKIPSEHRANWLLQWKQGTLREITFHKTEHQTETQFAYVPHLLIILWLLLLLIFALFLPTVAKIYLFIDFYQKPSHPTALSYTLIGYSVLCEICGFLLLVWKWIPTPFNDYGEVYELSDLKERNPEEFTKRITENLTEQRIKKSKIRRIKIILFFSACFAIFKAYSKNLDISDGINIEEFSIFGEALFEGFLFGITYFLVDTLFSRRPRKSPKSTQK
ncbi:hypothetical protein [Sneathiella chinensis]|uniref:hypothetical protein n=1 Tax=Sneathiella chinensis TaxID=349750 RepID=UPI00146CB0AE|nr:hypothetical protein [Sneathiella chinensis]